MAESIRGGMSGMKASAGILLVVVGEEVVERLKFGTIRRVKVRGGYQICLEMCGNGAKTGLIQMRMTDTKKGKSRCQ